MLNLSIIKDLSFITLLIICFCTEAKQSLDLEYSKDFTDIIEFVYGGELLSQGGTDSVDKMFGDEALDGKQILDIGSGLGGVDFYLAQKYKVNITAIDRVERLITQAKHRLKGMSMKGQIDFMHKREENSLIEFNDNTFDIIFAKESLLHIEDKKELLKDAYRILKPGGQIIIIDWVSHEKLGPNIQAMMALDDLDLELASEQEYEQLLRQQGFKNISLKNLNQDYIGYTQKNLERLKEKRALFIEKFGKENYEYSIKTWGFQKRAFEQNEVLIMLIKAQR